MKLKTLLLLAVLFVVGNAWADDLTISSAEDWKAFCNETAKYASGKITLNADIEVDEMFNSTFTGTLDGQGHTITYNNLVKQSDFALFKYTGNGAVVKNLNIAGNLKVIAGRAGGLVASLKGETTVENVKNSANITSSGSFTSGFVCNCKGGRLIAKNCEYSGEVWNYNVAAVDCGGFIGKVEETGSFSFSDCAFTGIVRLENENATAKAGWGAGGFIGKVNDVTAAADCYFTNCAVTGEIRQCNGAERAGGFIGSPQSDKLSYIMKGCLMAGKAMRWKGDSDPTWDVQEQNVVFGCNAWKSLGNKTSAQDCYFTSNTGVNLPNVNGFTRVDHSLMATGALCYLLNGDQSDIHWYQTLGSDQGPVLDNTHGQVYASGRKHCDGSDYEGVTYNNESGQTVQDKHNFVDGVCDYCQTLDLDAENFFHVTSQAAWENAVKTIEGGKNNLNVKLECDIVQNRVIKDGYCGILDGQGHSIDVTMGSEDKQDTYIGSGKVSMFGNIGGATIRNCVFVGEMIGSACSAPIANYNLSPLNVENVVSLVNMRQTTLTDGNFSGMVGCANNTINFKNCIVAGRITATKDAGGFVGWAGGQTINMENCAMIGDVTVQTGNSSVFLRIRHTDCKISLKNCFYLACTPQILNGNGTEMEATAKKIENEDMIASGALCYTLNGDQSKINFFQNLGEDQMPVPFADHAQVYASGRKHCDGSDYDDVTYNNTSGETTQDEHNYVDNFCSFCGKLHIGEDGKFHILSSEAFAAFAKAVKAGDTSLSAVLEENVNVSMGDEDCPMLNNYAGTFDGQGHTIVAGVDGKNGVGGIFANVRGATIKNLVAEGTIRNATQAGFVGQVQNGNVLIENVIVKMDIEGNLNVAGITGNADNMSGKTVTYRNVMFAGKAKYVGNANANGLGGFLGWSGGGTNFVMENCAMIADLDISGQPQKTALFVRANNGCTFKMTNCGYIPAEGVMFVNGHSGEANDKAAIVDNATDGSLCWALNGNSFQDPVWFQDLGDDAVPVLDNTHGIVYPAASGYASSLAENADEIINNLVDEAKDFADVATHPAQNVLVEAYLEAVETLTECTSLEEIRAAYYPTIENLRAAVASSQKAYDKLTQKVEETRKYLEDYADQFKGGACYQKLETYLSDEYVEPSEDEYPNGSYTYIIDPENLLLDEAAIEDEIKFIDKMLMDAMNEGLNPGADATQFIVNADFSGGFNAWEGTLMSSTTMSQVYENKFVAESWSKSAFDMHQTISVPENGIYELTINGAYRLNSQPASHQNSAMVYLNGNKNYLQAVIEDMIPAADAQDKVNAWITGDTPDYAIKDISEKVIGYTVHGQQGAACAFYNENPRYENRILVNVTDKTLTIGVKNSHVLTTDNEWVAVGNMKLTYCGTLDQADEALDATLASMKARAQFLLSETDFNEKAGYPNFSEALRTALSEKVSAIDAAESAEEKYTLVQEISEIFEQILECKANYKKMMAITDAFKATVDAMSEAGEISEEEAAKATAAVISNLDGYNNGIFTSEQAAKGGNLSESSLYPHINEDGAMEISSSTQLNVFAGIVNNGETTQNAVLTEDVEAKGGFKMIGTSSAMYAGTFDGQGHTVTLDIDQADKYNVGLFSYTSNAHIKNLRVAGNIKGLTAVGAFVGTVQGKTTFENVVSSAHVDGYNNVGGFVGFCTAGPQTWLNCLWDGKVSVTGAGSNGAGGYVGWSSDNTMTVRNCLSIGEIEGKQLAYFFRVKCDGTMNKAGAAGCIVDAKGMYLLKHDNCIDLEVNAPVIGSGTPLWWGEFLIDETTIITEEELASGKICYELNEGNTEDPVWRQNVNENLEKDEHPMLLTDHYVVYMTEDGKYVNSGEDGIESIQDSESTIHNDGSIYTISGQRVSKVQKGGLYIIGGKKYLVK